MRLLSAHAAKDWPEFSDLECYQCHHDLRAESWRIERGYPGRKPGTLQINTARFEVVRQLVAVAAPDQKAAFESAVHDEASDDEDDDDHRKKKKKHKDRERDKYEEED